MARVLIVDDEALIRTTFAAFLSRDGHEATSVATAEEALETAKASAFDVIVSDIHLDGLNGMGLLRALRSAASETKVILVTGRPSIETAAEAVRDSAFAYLAKPIERTLLCSTVREAARMKALEAENLRYREQLEELVEERTKRLSRMLDDTVETLGYAMEIRDPYTAGHQQRVSRLAVAIAKGMGLDEHRCNGIRFASILHDIGKLHIPAEILAKPALLTPEERSLVRDHSEHGSDILARIDFPWPIADIVLQHHERRDGTGYPKGLRGDRILLESRILAVSDVVEAMASHRPYRSALGIEAARREIQEQRGLLYDEAVVDACDQVLRDGFDFDADDTSSGA
jgi:putative two-component system response regulator